jgi:hypothetical protein
MRPRTPPDVTTSSPLTRASSIWRCSFWRFICGRIIMKNTMIISGIRMNRDMSPPEAGAVPWA